jgi:hypothetical protein
LYKRKYLLKCGIGIIEKAHIQAENKTSFFCSSCLSHLRNILYLPKCKMSVIYDDPLRKICLLKNVLLLISYTQYAVHVSSICLYNQCYCLHLYSQCLHLLCTYCHSTAYHQQSPTLHQIYSAFWNPSQSLLVILTAMPLRSTLTK